ncbi:TlyA family RNA methyltransferase [Clostridium aminobutyricum]|uniref:TlyA family RNA methyltransferase n=1 Tax=Clostridium aminobutyricum TaxID=33953 RepID=A0A939D6V9_CLOAM|nr:TlyA family RNA methyltransferase [Clostridium aminobutyricum]MBN7772519.1 TlyA family RNA methyltransferase [Clostridium aminobutyricum]
MKGCVTLLKDRLDVILVEKGLFASREKAKASIMAGIVYVDGQRIDKAGTQVSDSSDFLIKEDLCPYVSRGGLKLEKALAEFEFHLDGAVAVDIGASTGGFTDCMLKNNASKVFAIDVGYGQLDWKLRNDPRVVNMEKVNIRYLDVDMIDKDVDFISVDVSFISLKLVFPVASKLLAEGGSIVCLVKPQFEAGREQVGKKGIVRDIQVHREVLYKVIGYAAASGLYPHGLTFSPVTGAKGNIEYLLYLKKTENELFTNVLIEQVVNSSHKML